MASQMSHLPHFKNVEAGYNQYDPVHKAIFEVALTLPAAIAGEFQGDVELLTQQVTKVSGLDALQKTVGAGSQKFMGVDVSYLNPVLENTYAEITMELNLNLRNANDNYVLKIFRAWENLGYDLSDGTRTLKTQYQSDSIRIAEANRDGTVWRSYLFHFCELIEVTGLDDLEYTSNDARTLTVKFRSDYWDDDMA